MKRKFWIWKALKIALMITIFVNLVGYSVMMLWNWLIPVLFKGPVITFIQALGLLILARILFGGFRRNGGRFRGGFRRQQMQERFANMTPDEKEKFREKMQGRCGGRFGDFEQASPVQE